MNIVCGAIEMDGIILKVFQREKEGIGDVVVTRDSPVWDEKILIPAQGPAPIMLLQEGQLYLSF